MSKFHVMCFIAAISLSFALLTKEDAESLKKKIKYGVPFHFDQNNIISLVSSNWIFDLNISSVCKENDPDLKFNLYHNFTSVFTLPGYNEDIVMSHENQEEVDTPGKPITYQQLQMHNSEGKTVELNTSIFIQQNITSDIDFSDFSKKSVINYNVSFYSFVDIKFPYSNLLRNGQNEPSMVDVRSQTEAVLDKVFQVDGPVPLVNENGTGQNICVNKKCSSSTGPRNYTTSFVLFDNITMTVNRNVQSDVGCFLGLPQMGYSLYGRVSWVKIFYRIEMGIK